MKSDIEDLLKTSKDRDVANDFGEQMHLMGKIEMLLRLEIELQEKRQLLELRLQKIRESKPTPRRKKL